VIHITFNMPNSSIQVADSTVYRRKTDLYALNTAIAEEVKAFQDDWKRFIDPNVFANSKRAYSAFTEATARLKELDYLGERAKLECYEPSTRKNPSQCLFPSSVNDPERIVIGNDEASYPFTGNVYAPNLTDLWRKPLNTSRNSWTPCGF
jgi:hypothetical protein